MKQISFVLNDAQHFEGPFESQWKPSPKKVFARNDLQKNLLCTTEVTLMYLNAKEKENDRGKNKRTSSEFMDLWQNC